MPYPPLSWLHIAAAVAAPFWEAVAAASAAILVAGGLFLAHNRPKLLARYGSR